MAKLFSVASWNVEHFKGDGPDSARVDRVVAFLAEQKPDIFGMFEVEGKTVFETLVQRMPNYTFQITEGQQTQEILIGVKRTLSSPSAPNINPALPICARASWCLSWWGRRNMPCFSCTSPAASTRAAWGCAMIW